MHAASCPVMQVWCCLLVEEVPCRSDSYNQIDNQHCKNVRDTVNASSGCAMHGGFPTSPVWLLVMMLMVFVLRNSRAVRVSKTSFEYKSMIPF